MGKRKSYETDGVGPGCPRCGNPTVVRKHREVGERQLRQPFYYEKWFYCWNEECKTTLIMPDEHRVFPKEVSNDRARRSR